jgi:hypothetical protein
LILVVTGCSLDLQESAETAQEEAAGEVAQPGDLPQPNPALSPEQVVKIQLEALKNNDETNHGIEITFNFASPTNKKYTGPLPRFIQMVKNPLYRPMLNHRSAEYEPIEVSGDTARQRVILTGADGQTVIYLFSLSKQVDGPWKGCWMTDSVTAEPVRRQEQQQA